MRTIRLLTCVILLVFGTFETTAQSQQQPTAKATQAGQSSVVMPHLPAPADPTALSLMQKSLTALVPGTAIVDVTLVGNATRIAGSDIESGQITMKGLGTQFSRIDLSSELGTRTELRGVDSSGLPQNVAISPAGASSPIATHNAMTDAVWFFPALSTLSKNPGKTPNLAVTYVGAEQKNDVAVQHIHFLTELPRPNVSPSPRLPALDLSRLTAMDVYLDASSSLPVALAFATHPDKNSLIDIQIEVDFSNYQSVQGVLVPFHIQKYLNGTLFLDVTVQSVSINSGLSAAQFTTQ